WNVGSPAVGNIDGDPAHTLDVVATSRQGYLFAWRTKGHENGVVQWESFHHDNANTGDYAVKLSQGVLKKATSVIDCSVPTAPPPDSFEAGGCGACRAGSAAPDARTPILVAFGVVAGAMLRRRRRFIG